MRMPTIADKDKRREEELDPVLKGIHRATELLFYVLVGGLLIGLLAIAKTLADDGKKDSD